MKKCNYRTFPGKDRETELDLRPIILAVLDPGGNLLSKDDMQVYIKSDLIMPYPSNKYNYGSWTNSICRWKRCECCKTCKG